MTELFKNGSLLYQPDTSAAQKPVAAYTELYLDGNAPVTFCMVQQSGGKQNARIHIQATLNGDFYITGCSSGVGMYEMLFIDGVTTGACGENAAADSILSKYIGLKDIKARKATIKIYNPSGAATSKACGVFNGVVHGMSTRLVEEQDGSLLLYVGLSVLGGWGTE